MKASEPWIKTFLKKATKKRHRGNTAEGLQIRSGLALPNQRLILTKIRVSIQEYSPRPDFPTILQEKIKDLISQLIFAKLVNQT